MSEVVQMTIEEGVARARRVRKDSPYIRATLMRVAVVTSTPLFVEGGHLVMARALVDAFRESGHEAELVLTPQNRFGRQGAARDEAGCRIPH